MSWIRTDALIHQTSLVLSCCDREEYHEQFEELQPGIPEDTFITILGLIEWNDQQLDGLYNYVYQNGQQQARCGGDDNSVSNKYLIQ